SARGGREDVFSFIMQESERAAEHGVWDDGWSWGEAVYMCVGPGDSPGFVKWALHFAPDNERELFGGFARGLAIAHPQEFDAWLTTLPAGLDFLARSQISSALARGLTLTRGNVAADRAVADALPPGLLRDTTRFEVAMEALVSGDD